MVSRGESKHLLGAVAPKFDGPVAVLAPGLLLPPRFLGSQFRLRDWTPGGWQMGPVLPCKPLQLRPSRVGQSKFSTSVTPWFLNPSTSGWAALTSVADSPSMTD